MRDCPHEYHEREASVFADGLCPICMRADNERLRGVLGIIACGGTKYDSAADLIRIARRALEPSMTDQAEAQAALDAVRDAIAALRPFAALASADNWAHTVWEKNPKAPIVVATCGMIGRPDFEAAARALENLDARLKALEGKLE